MTWHKVGLGILLLGFCFVTFGILVISDLIEIDNAHIEWSLTSLFFGFALIFVGNGLTNYYRAHLAEKEWRSWKMENMQKLNYTDRYDIHSEK